MITVGGAEHEDGTGVETPGGRRRPAVAAVLGVTVGLTMGVIFAGGSTRPASSTTTIPDAVFAPSASPTTTITTITVPVQRLATMAPGVVDTLIMVSIDSTGIESVTRWEPLGRTPVPSSLPVGALDADVSRRWLAGLTDSRYADRETLWVGNDAYLEPFRVSEIAGMTWHERLPGELAWVERDGETHLLRTARFLAGRPIAEHQVAAFDAPVTPVWWTDAGITVAAVYGDQTSLSLVSQTGETVAEVTVRAVVSGSDSLAAVIDASGAAMLIDSNLDVVGPAPWDGSCIEGEFTESDVDLAIALHCQRPEGETLEVWRRSDRGFTLFVSVAVDNGSQPGWTADGALAYLVGANPLRPSTELIFVRMVDGEVLTVTHPGRVVQMETMRD